MLESFQLFDGRQNLANLICLGLPFFVLDVDARIARPWCLEDRVTRTALAGLAKALNA
jgi:hypothetical protein